MKKKVNVIGGGRYEGMWRCGNCGEYGSYVEGKKSHSRTKVKMQNNVFIMNIYDYYQNNVFEYNIKSQL